MPSSRRLFNRELSWLRFNERVLEEAQDTSHPLLERLRFLTIFSSNLDEFFSIRVSALQEQLNANIVTRSPDGLTPIDQIRKINSQVEELLGRVSSTLLDDIMPKLAEEDICICPYAELSEEQRTEAEAFFREKVFPVLTPLAMDPSHPVPHLRSMGLNLLVKLRDPMEKGEHKQAFVPIPPMLPRFLTFEKGSKYTFVLIEDIIEGNLSLLFPKMLIHQVWHFRVTRNADLEIADAEADDLLKLIERELRKRRLGIIQRLEVEEDMGPKTCKLLRDIFEMESYDIYRVRGRMALDYFRELVDTVNRPDLKYAPYTPNIPEILLKSENIFAAIATEDILLHQPYDSFRPVLELVQVAAKDPDVLAIKQTLYRTGGRSTILQALIEAANNGKQVTVLMELKARFDEQTNIAWAKELERAGANVVYGLMGLKTHCKTLLILRREGDQLRRYVHMSTGNYNERSATQYTDISLMTCDPAIGDDIGELFNYLTGYSRQEDWRKVLIAPVNMRQRFNELLNECIANHTQENPSHIQLVMNALVDPDLIEDLYRASNAGVKVDCVVRGICCLVPGVKGMSENIEVRSILGRFLEHSRIFCFRHSDVVKLYAGSADWMPRNLNHRVEVVFPIEAPHTREQILQILDMMMRDNTKARFLQTEGGYVRHLLKNKKDAFSAQQFFVEKATRNR
jgi:polyphosphate kinase